MNQSPFNIRNATLSDIEQMVALLKVLFSIEIDFKFDADVQRRGLRLLMDGCGKHRCIRVAEMNGQVVGMCTAQTLISTAEGGPAAMIEDLVVHVKYRNKGIGTELLASIESWARNLGIHRMQLLADKTNTPAMLFYKRQKWGETRLICLRKML